MMTSTGNHVDLYKFCCIILLTLSMATKAETTSLIETALEYKKNNQFADAISCYEKIIQDKPNNVEVLFNLGCCYFFMSNKDKSIAAFDEVIKKHPYLLDVLYNKALV